MTSPQDILIKETSTKPKLNASKISNSELENDASKLSKRTLESKKPIVEKKTIRNSRAATPINERCVENSSKLLDKSTDRSKDLTASRITSRKDCIESDNAHVKNALKPNVKPRSASYLTNLVNQTTTPNIHNAQSKISELIQRDKKLSKTKNHNTFEESEIIINVKQYDSANLKTVSTQKVELDFPEEIVNNDVHSVSTARSQRNLKQDAELKANTDRIVSHQRNEGETTTNKTKSGVRPCDLRRTHSQVPVVYRKLDQIGGDGSSGTEPVSEEEEDNSNMSFSKNSMQNKSKTKRVVRNPLSHKSSDTSMFNDRSFKEDGLQKSKAQAVHATPRNQRPVYPSQQNSEFRDQRLMSIDSQKSFNAPYLFQSSMDNFSQYSTDRRISNSSTQYIPQYDPRYLKMRSNSGFGYIPQPQPNYNLQPLLISPTNLMQVPQNFNLHPGYTQIPPRGGLINCVSPSQYVQMQPQFPVQYQQNYVRPPTPIESNLPFSPNQNQMIMTNRGYGGTPMQGTFPPQMGHPLSSPNGFAQQTWERSIAVTQGPQIWNGQLIVQTQNQGMPFYPGHGMQAYQTQPNPMPIDTNSSRENFRGAEQPQPKDPTVTSFELKTQGSECRTSRN